MVVDILFKEEAIKDAATIAIFGAYSRTYLSTLELKEKYLEIVNGKPDYIRFAEDWIKKYHHDSLMDHGFLHLFIEGISQYLTKILETYDLKYYELPLGITEKSTRYADFSKQNPEDLAIMGFLDSDLKKEFLDIYNYEMNFYSEMSDNFREFLKKSNLDEKLALDSSRSLLPAGVTTTVGITLDFRSARNLIYRLEYEKSYGNRELEEFIDKLINLLTETFPFIYDKNEIETELKKIDLYKKELMVKSVAFYEYGIYSGLACSKVDYDFLYKEVIDEKLFKGIKFLTPREVNFISGSKKYYSCSDKNSLLEEISLIKSLNGGKLNEYMLSSYHFLMNDDLVYSASIDYGSYRDIARHRGISFFPVSHFMIYVNKFIEQKYILFPILADKEKGIFEKIALYYKDLLCKLESFTKHLSERDTDLTIYERNSKMLNILSYLIPMSISKEFVFKSDIKNIIHLVKERTQLAGHYNYRKFAKELGDKLAKSLNVPYNYIFGEFLPSKEDSLGTIVSFDRWNNLLTKEQFELAELLEKKILDKEGRMNDNSL